MDEDMSEPLKYYWLSPKDQRFNIWIFHRETNETGARLREEYLPLKCSRCGKFDELKALDMGVPQGIRIRSKSDYLVSHDGIVCISNEGQQALTEAGVSGLRFLAIPGNGGYSIALPHSFVPTDPDLSQMKFHRQCKQCGRFRETCFKASSRLHVDPQRSDVDLLSRYTHRINKGTSVLVFCVRKGCCGTPKRQAHGR